MSGLDAQAPRIARSLLLTGLILVPGVLAAGLELRHRRPDESLTTALEQAHEAREKLSPIDDRLNARDAARLKIDEQVAVIRRLKREQPNPADALAEAGERIPRGFAVSEISCRRETSGSAHEWVVVIHGDPTDAEAATWAERQGRPMPVGHVAELRLVTDPELDRGWPESENPWW